jgi:uncharacterized damage-inducible protein DinB
VTTWTAPPAERTDPDHLAGERTALESWVDFHRATLLQKCAGLTAEQLAKRAVPPSTLSLIGLVRHMTDVERWWFRSHVAGERLPYAYWSENDADRTDYEFDEATAENAERDLAAYRQEIDAARASAATVDLDHTVSSVGHRKDVTIGIRWIYLHMIEEYARHNGHADLLRERIDGATGD